jgi:acyl-CoA synthetase (AMP-forming)/AMP-acid ligase II
MTTAGHLSEALAAHAAQNPEQLAFVFLGAEDVETEVTYADLDRRAAGIAAALGEYGVKVGNLVVMILPDSPELIYAFWGVTYLGGIPSIFPDLNVKSEAALYWDRIEVLVQHARPNAIIAPGDMTPGLKRLISEEQCRVIGAQELLDGQHGSEARLGDEASGADIAVLQFSSGTTGVQKGVAVSHQSVLAHHNSLARAIELTGQDRIISWLPLHHDLGLLGGLLLPIIEGIPTILMPATEWVRNPAKLLSAIDRYKATVCWMPNFAFNHTVNSVRKRDMEQLNLKSFRLLINSAEPVRHESIELFMEKFASVGFREGAVGSGYGMAENGGVTISPMGVRPRVDWIERKHFQEAGKADPAEPEPATAIPIVSCGVPMQGVELLIVDKDGTELPDREIGEIALRSPFMFGEYYNRPDITRKAMRDGWFFTGDLGYLADGHLFVTGRKKDLIIVAGKNIYPEDIETIANSVPGVYPGRTAAFGVFDEKLGSEAIVLVYEPRSREAPTNVRAIERELRQIVLDRLDVALQRVVPVERGWILKAPSGKTARAANRSKYLSRIGADPGHEQ